MTNIYKFTHPNTNYDELVKKLITKKKFIESTNNPKLTKATLKQGGIDWDDLIKYPYDYYDAASGSVNGMIYYANTVKFAKKYQDDILDELDLFEDETGAKLNKPKRIDKTLYYNWLSWFAWENMMSNLINQLESYNYE